MNNHVGKRSCGKLRIVPTRSIRSWVLIWRYSVFKKLGFIPSQLFIKRARRNAHEQYKLSYLYIAFLLVDYGFKNGSKALDEDLHAGVKCAVRIRVFRQKVKGS